MWFSDEIAGTAGDDVVDASYEAELASRAEPERSHTPQNTSKTCTNVDNVMIKLQC